MTIPELYPDLTRLLGEYFSLETARNGARYRDAVLVFVLTEPHSTLLQTASDAKAILAVDSELAAFEAFVREVGLDFATLGEGVTVEDWLADVVTLISGSV
ncbi:MAG TPA: contact-dependent growth inhibition system immunity protein [Gemmatimonadaceae bacterium]|nr:contact-dependent growth inhibition system immunity protein [Gemmatimonadaceae bacterium]